MSHTPIDCGECLKWVNPAGRLHRDGDLPAVVWKDGARCEWYRNGVRNRETGPAIVTTRDIPTWYADIPPAGAPCEAPQGQRPPEIIRVEEHWRNGRRHGTVYVPRDRNWNQAWYSDE